MGEPATASKAFGKILLMMTVKWAIIYGVTKSIQRTKTH